MFRAKPLKDTEHQLTKLHDDDLNDDDDDDDDTYNNYNSDKDEETFNFTQELFIWICREPVFTCDDDDTHLIG